MQARVSTEEKRRGDRISVDKKLEFKNLLLELEEK
jgi:hypothetical protein